jgi:hypothetical protein
MTPAIAFPPGTRNSRTLSPLRSNFAAKPIHAVVDLDWGVQLSNRNLSEFKLTREGRVSIREIRRSVAYVQRGFDRAVYQANGATSRFRV